MCLPCVKFITFAASYIFFLIVIILASFRLFQQPIDYKKFSHAYSHLFPNYTAYAKNDALKIKFEPVDFYFRSDQPFSLDILICVWLLGDFEFRFNNFIIDVIA
jgi:hypothetical protein